MNQRAARCEHRGQVDQRQRQLAVVQIGQHVGGDDEVGPWVGPLAGALGHHVELPGLDPLVHLVTHLDLRSRPHAVAIDDGGQGRHFAHRTAEPRQVITIVV